MASETPDQSNSFNVWWRSPDGYGKNALSVSPPGARVQVSRVPSDITGTDPPCGGVLTVMTLHAGHERASAPESVEVVPEALAAKFKVRRQMREAVRWRS